jgi:hypothetical protein
MDLFLLLGILIGAPILVVGGIQYLIFKLAGGMALRVVCAIAASYCTVVLISAYGAPPLLGNKAAYAGVADGVTAILLLECLAILLWPLARRFFGLNMAAETRRAAEAEQTIGISK